MHTRRFLAATLAGVALFALGACGGGGDTSGSAENGSGQPVAGGTATILTMSDPTSLDPARLGNSYAITAAVGNALYGHLLTTNDVGDTQPSMAEFTTADNGATFTLKLKPGLAFSDGTPFDAAAVKFNWERLKDPTTGSVNRAEATQIASTEVVDATTLKVNMTSPRPRFGTTITEGAFNWIGSPAALQKGAETFNKNPIGAGPFTLKAWTRGAQVELVKNTRYFDAPKPYLDGVIIRAVTDANQRYNTVLTGGAQLAMDSNWHNIAKGDEAGLTVQVQQLGGGIFMGLNTRRAPFDDIRARQAVSYALDLDMVNQAAYSGDGKNVDTLFTKGSPFYTDTPLHRHDPAKAQELFDELAADGKPVSFTFSSFPTTENRAIAESVQTQLSSFKNVKVEVSVIDFSQLAQLRSAHDYDILVASATFLDPDPTLWLNFSGDSVNNPSGIDDAGLNKALLTGQTATSQDERKAAYATAEERIIELVPAIFVTRAAPGLIADKNLHGLVQYGNGSMVPEELWISK